jgi:hypothetical protein
MVRAMPLNTKHLLFNLPQLKHQLFILISILTSRRDAMPRLPFAYFGAVKARAR